MPPPPPLTKGIKELFYETRVLMGRRYTLRRFAEEALGGSIDAVTLSCIENGTRFPSEATVRRLAVLRNQDPHELLVLLWRDRMVHAFGRELDRALSAPRGVAGIEDAELAIVVSHAIASLPADGGWMPVAQWRRTYRSEARRRRAGASTRQIASKRIESILLERAVIQICDTRVRRAASHFVARGIDEQRSLVLEFFALFARTVLDKLAFPGSDSGTYLRNHYLDIAPETVDAFRRDLESALHTLAQTYAVDRAAGTRFMNVLVAASPI